MADSSSSSDGWKAEKKITVDVQAGDDPEVEIEANTPTDVEYVHFIDRVSSDRQVMSPGGTCEVSIDTVFAHIGCPITLTCKDKNGTFKTIKGKMLRRSKTFSIPVPREAEGHVIVEADLEGAKETVTTDGVVALTKPITVQEIRWSAEETKEGETVTLTAQVSEAANGYPALIRIQENDPTVPNGGGKTIATFRKTVENGGVELHWMSAIPIRREDILTEKEREAERERGTEVPAYEKPSVVAEVEVLGIVGQSWRKPGKPSGKYSGKMAYSDDLTLQVVDATSGAPLANQDVTLTLADGTETTETLGSDGTLTLEDVAPGAARLRLSNPTPPQPEAEGEEDGDNEHDSGQENGAFAAEGEPTSLTLHGSDPSVQVLTGAPRRVEVGFPSLNLRLESELGGAAVGDVQYEIEVETEEGETTRLTGTAGPDGEIHQSLPSSATGGTLRLRPGESEAPARTWTLVFPEPTAGDEAARADGSSASEAEITRAQRRLNQLGYRCGPDDGTIGPMTRTALRRFQTEMDEPPTALRRFQTEMDEPPTGRLTDSTRLLLDALRKRS